MQGTYHRVCARIINRFSKEGVAIYLSQYENGQVIEWWDEKSVFFTGSQYRVF